MRRLLRRVVDALRLSTLRLLDAIGQKGGACLRHSQSAARRQFRRVDKRSASTTHTDHVHANHSAGLP